jgi:chaperonin GroEL
VVESLARAVFYGVDILAEAGLANDEQWLGVDIMCRSLTAPFRLIAEIAGMNGERGVTKLLESDDTDWGLDAQTGTYCDLVKAGIIDPTKVMRTALQDAASAAGLLVTTEAMIAEVPEKEKTPAMAGQA